MADAIISVALEKISDLLINEASFLSSVREEAEILKNELKRIKCFLKDVDYIKNDQREVVRDCIAELSDIAYDAEDIIDEFIVRIPIKEEGTSSCCWSVTVVSKAPQLHDIGIKIRSIQTRIGRVLARLQSYCSIQLVEAADGSASATSASEMRRRLRRTNPDDEEKDIITLDSTINNLMNQLMNPEDQLRIVSIVGMGGIGKTTLAKIAYNFKHVKQHFDCCSWSFISQQFSPRDILLEILMQVSPEQDRQRVSSMSEAERVKQLKDLLKVK
ncbi:putative disease resistance protein At1g50180 [Mercurialis annua]|uniref:putative disease resistance protein At1g50180 n=1 Tax=Mercurialis annua TaxID=3986 RepID=UPI00215EAEDC|nr:putative disease resistance protein At1g50180 [Mercurialis annua]